MCIRDRTEGIQARTFAVLRPPLQQNAENPAQARDARAAQCEQDLRLPIRRAPQLRRGGAPRLVEQHLIRYRTVLLHAGADQKDRLVKQRAALRPHDDHTLRGSLYHGKRPPSEEVCPIHATLFRVHPLLQHKPAPLRLDQALRLHPRELGGHRAALDREKIGQLLPVERDREFRPACALRLFGQIGQQLLPRRALGDVIELLREAAVLLGQQRDGDLSSQSRFVKVAFTKLNSISGEEEDESVSQFFHILGSVDQQRGCCEVTEGKYEITIYTSCCNTAKGIYYYTTYDNHQITAVDMHAENLDSDQLICYPLLSKGEVRWQNK